MNAKRLKRRLLGMRGQGMTEYIIIVGLIALLLIAAVRAYRDEVEIAIIGTEGENGARTGGATGTFRDNVDTTNDDSAGIGGFDEDGGEPPDDAEPDPDAPPPAAPPPNAPPPDNGPPPAAPPPDLGG